MHIRLAKTKLTIYFDQPHQLCVWKVKLKKTLLSIFFKVAENVFNFGSKWNERMQIT